MRTVLLGLPLVVLASAASAQAMPNSRTMSCANAQRLIQQNGSALMASGPAIFDRYVASVAFCPALQITRPAWVATADNPKCFIGYRCTDRNRRLSR